MEPLNIFYSEPDPDRWFAYDRYPRKLIRRIYRGRQRPGGVAMIGINLMKGLQKSGIPYRYNNYDYIKKNTHEIACIIGKPHVLFNRKWKNPVILGAGIYSHPMECPDLFKIYPVVKKILVPGEWMRRMFEPFYGDKVLAWPAGIDTDEWNNKSHISKSVDFLIYDKIRWEHSEYENDLIHPIIEELNSRKLTWQIIKYGAYKPDELKEKINLAKAVIFLCEHETQGLAYQQILATNIPIMAWDRGGYWQDPYYYPHKVQYSPVSSVPYWDDRCGVKFSSFKGFTEVIDSFLQNLNRFSPRSYILENLTLEKSAEQYLKIYNQVKEQLTLNETVNDGCYVNAHIKN